MSLRDKACYTLSLVPAQQPNVLYLIENYNQNRAVEDQAIRYGRVRETSRDGEVYSAALYDAFSQAKLASTGLFTERLRSRRLELHGPDEKVPFEFTGKLGFEWSFQFEGNKYMWKRDGGITSKDMACFMDRRPDPNIDIALGRVAGRDGKPAQLSILHYNIERFLGHEIKDLRGLETLLAITFTALIDGADSASNSRQSSGSQAPKPAQNKPLPAGPPTSAPQRPSPPPEVYNEDANEVIVGVNTDLNTHIDRAIALLEDPSILFIIIRTKDARAAQRALQVVLGVNRFRHRNQQADLHQYVLEEEAESKGPRVIKLDDAPFGAPSWKPPPNLAIYLSTIELPDLKAGGAARANSNKRPTPVAQARPASMVGSVPTLSTPVPPQHRPASPNLRPVSPNPNPRPISPRPPGQTGMLNAPIGGSNRPASISGSIPNAGYVPPIPPPSGFQPSPAPGPSGFQPAPAPAPPPSGFQPQAQWGAPGFSGGYSESPFLHGLFRPNHKH